MSTNLILDLGSDTVKAGTSHDALPALIFPSVVGQPIKKRTLLLRKQQDESTDDNAGKYLVGADAMGQAAQASMVRPIRHGIVEDWAMFEHIANHTFEQLGINPEEACVTITEPVYNPKHCTDTLAQTFFETFGVHEMALMPSGVCALYASGRTTGIVLDSGDGVTQITPVFDSFLIPNATNRINCGGQEVTEHLRRLLCEKGFTFSSAEDSVHVQAIKNGLCYVSTAYASDISEEDEGGFMESFTLPDGQSIKLDKERFRAPEILFQPEIIHSEVPSLQDFVVNSVKACAIDIRKALLSNIVVVGGNTVFPYFGQRLKEEVQKSFTGLFGSIHVVEDPDRMYATYAGATVVASLPSFSGRVVSRHEYDEVGPSVLREHIPTGGDDDEEELPPPE